MRCLGFKTLFYFDFKETGFFLPEHPQTKTDIFRVVSDLKTKHEIDYLKTIIFYFKKLFEFIRLLSQLL